MASTLQRTALWDFVAFCWRQVAQSGRMSLAIEALFLELGSLVIPLYTSFVLISIGRAGNSTEAGEGNLIAPLIAAATGIILIYLAGRRYVEPRLKAALAEDDAMVRRYMLATYERSGRLEKVAPETFDDEFEQFARLGRLMGRDTVKVSAYAMAFVVFVPVELIFTGPVVLVSICFAWVTLETVLAEGDSFRRAQWELAEDGIETMALRRLWMRYIRPLTGIYSNRRLMKGLFGFLDRELNSFKTRYLAEKKLFGSLDLLANLERIILMTVAAIGIVTGFFDISQFVLILFVAGRLQVPLRGILEAWLSTGRPVQGMQAMQRLFKSEGAGRLDKLMKDEHHNKRSPEPRQHQMSAILWKKVASDPWEPSELGLPQRSVAAYCGEAITVNGSLIENLTLGSPSLTEIALLLLSWSGLQPWVASLPDGINTRLEEDNAVLPSYISQLISAFRILIHNPHSVVVIDNKNALLEPETISGIINVLQRWDQHPKVLILGSDQAWSALHPEELD